MLTPAFGPLGQRKMVESIRLMRERARVLDEAGPPVVLQAGGRRVGEQWRNVLEDDSRLRVVGDIADAFPDEVRHGTGRHASYRFPVWMHG
jgi:hypothetical protein